jgi:hypothetical protein
MPFPRSEKTGAEDSAASTLTPSMLQIHKPLSLFISFSTFRH